LSTQFEENGKTSDAVHNSIIEQFQYIKMIFFTFPDKISSISTSITYPIS